MSQMFGNRFKGPYPTTTPATTTTMSPISTTISTLPPTAVPNGSEHHNNSNNNEENMQLIISLIRYQLGEQFMRFLSNNFCHNQKGDDNNKSENKEQFTTSEVVLAVGGALVVLHFTN